MIDLDSRIKAQDEVICWILDHLRCKGRGHKVNIKDFKIRLREQFNFFKLKCTSCNRWLSPNEFSSHRTASNNKSSWCKSCSYLVKLYGGKLKLPPGILDSLPPHFIPKKPGLIGNKNRNHGTKTRYYKTKTTIKRSRRRPEENTIENAKTERIL